MHREYVVAWIVLILAGLFEVAWAFLMKSSEGFTKLWPSVGTIGFMIVSFGLLSFAMKSLPLGTAYAIWTGIGALGAVIIGIIAFHEPATAPRLIFAGLLLVGIVGLELTST